MSNLSDWILYNLRKVSTVNAQVKSQPLQSMKNAISTNTLIKLVHYRLNQPVFPLQKYMFWTEALTDEPLVASQATGIPATECVWRIEWSFPAQQAETLAEPLQKRMSNVGAYMEYNNVVLIDAQHCTITKL